ncbi:alpha/beta fold hydrolase [Denitromonas iodatirespirans]|uniref:Alpha/beta hydrolase n=1 Tax=Denitromonas iodatirespirans TaxID=2795389 RepID=A0A944HB48_DENI1|nr:alpha/beta hydrolase [Denitromonas iodatirespirans]MBT0964150.1 alpha/beta hydrolase [Denitromonas iodatirespirans]
MRYAVLAVVTLAVTGCAEVVKPDTKMARSIPGAQTDGTFIIAGSGKPVVVFQSGFQEGKDSWHKVLPEIARTHQVFAYDRPGHGDAQFRKGRRDPCAIAAEERALLRSKGVNPPYVLVGHSLGGLYQYVFAKMYPQDVAGVVLLDPTHPRHLETLKKESPGSAAMLSVIRAVGFSQSDKAEFDDQAKCLDSINMRQPVSAPVELLVSGRFRSEEKGDFEKAVKRLRQDWLKILGISEYRTVWDSGHYIQDENPAAVLAAIRNVVRKR